MDETTQKFNYAIVEDDSTYAFIVDQLLPCARLTRFAEISEFTDMNFEVVFTDLRLIETYGVETVNLLRQKTAAPIIVLTGMGGPYLSGSDNKALMDAGADEVFNKDIVNDPKFPAMVRAIIEKKKGLSHAVENG